MKRLVAGTQAGPTFAPSSGYAYFRFSSVGLRSPPYKQPSCVSITSASSSPFALNRSVVFRRLASSKNDQPSEEGTEGEGEVVRGRKGKIIKPEENASEAVLFSRFLRETADDWEALTQAPKKMSKGKHKAPKEAKKKKEPQDTDTAPQPRVHKASKQLPQPKPITKPLKLPPLKTPLKAQQAAKAAGKSIPARKPAIPPPKKPVPTKVIQIKKQPPPEKERPFKLPGALTTRVKPLPVLPSKEEIEAKLEKDRQARREIEERLEAQRKAAAENPRIPQFRDPDKRVDVLLCAPGYERVLLDQLRSALPQHVDLEAKVYKGWILASWNRWALHPGEVREFYKNSIWALQILPGCMVVKGGSIADLALQAYGKVVPYLLQNKVDPALQLGEWVRPAGATGRAKKESLLDELGWSRSPKDEDEEDEEEEEKKEEGQGEGEGEGTEPLSEEEIKKREQTAKRKRIEEERRIEDEQKKQQELEQKRLEEERKDKIREAKYGQLKSVQEEKRALRYQILEEVNRKAADVDFDLLGEWALHTSVPLDSSLYRKSKLIQETFLNTIRNKHMKLGKKQVALGAPGAMQIQFYLITETEMLVSVEKLRFSNNFGWFWPLPFESGRVKIPPNKNPPSRAYRKIDEIYELLYNSGTKRHLLKPGSVCVELGSAPGGWTRRLLDWSMRVISVDRAPLHPSLTGHRNLIRHDIADGATWVPQLKDGVIDCVFCDMLIPAHKSAFILQQWVTRRLAKRFVWTLKFVGKDQYQEVLPSLTAMLNAANCDFIVRHLANHGNEVVIIGRIM